jgi:thioredoxin 1
MVGDSRRVRCLYPDPNRSFAGVRRERMFVGTGRTRPKEKILMADGITTLTATTFDEEVLGAEVPVLVDFWAEWCGPCKMIAPILDEIAVEQAGKISIAKLNVDEAADVARRFEVMSIPTLIVFKDGAPAKRIVGAKGKAALLDDLAEYI